ncbi:hypothetical protein D8B46_07685 [Candidatus Gracilibacteria bacterium]|nr:MAG: hypothetical protein D8B46_07685 [Candidatus Gracilibacteria bacterium]
MNKKIISGTIAFTLLLAGVGYTYANTTENSTKVEKRGTLTEEQKAKFEKFRTIKDKVSSSQTLTADEQKLYDEFKAEKEKIKALREKQSKGETLTTEEQNLLNSVKGRKHGKGHGKVMTAEQKAEFEKYRTIKSKKEKGEALTAGEQKVYDDFQAKKAEMKSKTNSQK